MHISVEGGDPKDIDVTVDEARIAPTLLGLDIPADPGRRHIVGKRGAEIAEQTVDLTAGERKEITLRFRPLSPMGSPAPMAAGVQAPPVLAVPATVSPPGMDETINPTAAYPAGGVPLASPSLSDNRSLGGGTAPDLHQTSAQKDETARTTSYWWLWTGVGAAVVGGIVTAAILLTRKPERNATCSTGLSGCIGVGR